MVTFEYRHIISKNKDLDKSLKIWLEDIKKNIEQLEYDKIHIQTRIRQARDGDIRVSSIITPK